VSRAQAADCRIALFRMDEGQFQDYVQADCIEVAKRHGFPVRVFTAGGDSSKQVEQIQACLREPKTKRPTAILVWPVLEAALLSCAFAAARLGIAWVLLGRRCTYMAALREAFPGLAVFSIWADQREIGRIQGQQFKALLPEGGELVYLRGPLGASSAQQRFEGAQQVLKDSAINLFAVTSDWTIDGGARAMKDWLQIFNRREFPKFLVGSQNDDMAMGARRALEETARVRSDFSIEQIRFTGCDGAPEYGRRLVTAGKLTATVIMPSNGGRAVSELAPTLLSARPPPEAEIALAPTSFPELDVLAASLTRKRP
jgi:ABC-type sugar transport system substrate-binding protein